MSINWNNIRSLANSQNEGFEELVCQLAKKENIENKKIFIRKGKPDAGVECLWILNNNDEFAWQAKFFTSSIEETQLTQIDKSVTTVIKKHPNLKKYYIAIPNDPPDARIDGQTSMLEKWNLRVSKWKKIAEDNAMNVEFIPWWSSDLIERLQKPENVGLTYFWFNKEEFTDEWCNQQTEFSITDLGKRYTPKLNVKLEISEIFNGISRDENFERQVTNLFDDLLVKGYKIIPKIKDLGLDSYFSDIKNKLEAIHDLFKEINLRGIQVLPIEEFLELLININKLASHIKNYYLDKESKLQVEHSDDYRYYKKFGHEISTIREFESSIYELTQFLEGTTMNLANKPFLLLEGEAGIGKSHLLADVISTRTSNNLISLLFLGQHFVTDEDPWTQIFKKNDIKCSVNEFLGALNSKAQISGKRIVIFIDAVNEGRGKYFWDKNIKSFLLQIRKYEWLGVVMSIRTSYSELIFPKDEIKNDEIIRYTHYGFRNQEYEATKLFFNNYSIELPSIPLLHPEFQNPLFLLLFCEGLNKMGYTRIPDGLQGITTIIDFFINGVNNLLSKPDRLDYSKSINIVRKAIELLIKYKSENQIRYIPYEEALILINKIQNDFALKRGLLDELISEGILSKNLFWNLTKHNEEGVYLAYERFEDHLTATFILGRTPEIAEAFKNGGALFYLVSDENSCYINKGLIEALTIQLPEKTGKEFYEYVPHVMDSFPIVECFVQSLLWRKTETTTEKLVEYINSSVFKYKGTHDLFWDTILSVTSTPNHYFNAYSLHERLMKDSLPYRDSWWTIYLKNQFYDESAVKRLIEWAWNTNDKNHVSDESIKLSAITLSWFHTSTNRKLRDSATKALICLLENRIHILIELLKKFENVNDPYVYERLFAVAYGCALRTEQRDKLNELAVYIFKTIFEKEEIYPHILLRDYARGVIEYVNYLGINLNIKFTCIQPPYKSTWDDKIPSEQELEKKYDNPQYSDLWYSVMGFGDFARYIIGTNNNHSEWSGYKKNEVPIDRNQVYKDFKKKLSKEQLNLLTNLNPIISEENHEKINLEENINFLKIAIGRKTAEELKKNSDSFKNSLTNDLLQEYEKEIEAYLDYNHKIINTAKKFDLRIAQRLIFSKIIKLGWNPEEHFSFDKSIGTGRERNTYPHERIGKKYQWIAYYEFLALLSDHYRKSNNWEGINKEESYQGPWEPYVRDIDPTMIISKTGSYNEEIPKEFWWSQTKYFNWNLNQEDWIKLSNDIPCAENIINIKDEKNEEWLILEGHPEWNESRKVGDEKWNKSQKRMWYQLRSYLIAEEDYDKIKQWALNKEFTGRGMPEIASRYEVFSREYYWSPAYNYFNNNEYYGGKERQEIRDNLTNEHICDAILTTNEFLWGEELDNSKEETISFLKPSKYIYENMKLRFSKKEGEFIDETGKIMCFATSVYLDSNSYLLIKKEPFLNFLKENKLRILWTVLGEKNVIGGHGYYGRLEISGAYYLNENDELVGNINKRNN